MADPRSKSDAVHARCRALIERHLDGDLEPEERMELFDHLEECEECGRILEAEQRLLKNLNELPRLMMPSDVRAQLLRVAEREHREANVALHEEEDYARLLQGADADEGEPVVVFAGTTARPGGRPQSAWRRHSPVLAMVFLAVASVGALLTGDFSSIRPLAVVQSTLREGLNVIAAGSSRHAGGSEESLRAGTSAGADAARESSRAQSTMEPTPAADELPLPAECARPRLAAIVLRPTDAANAYGFDRDELGETVCGTALELACGQVSASDQFVCEGHRYRLYTLEVTDTWFDALVRRLDTCRSDGENGVFDALSGQGLACAPGSVAVYAAPKAVLRRAILEARPGASVPTDSVREIHVVVVD